MSEILALTHDLAWVRSLLECPDCHAELRFENPTILEARCQQCSFVSGKADFLPRQPGSRSLEFSCLYEAVPDLRKVSLGPPPITYSGPTPHRNAVDLFSLIPPPAVHGQALALDLGCGGGQYRPIFQALGYRYVGVDVEGTGPTLLADAHTLPFKDAAFDVVLSVAALQYFHNPFLALSEVRRVLKPGGVFAGVAAFGEPFCTTYFHASWWGLASLFHATGFQLQRLWSCRDTLRALAATSPYPKPVRWLLRGVSLFSRLPWLSPRRWWSGAPVAADTLETAGSIGFLTHKQS